MGVVGMEGWELGWRKRGRDKGEGFSKVPLWGLNEKHDMGSYAIDGAGKRHNQEHGTALQVTHKHSRSSIVHPAPCHLPTNLSYPPPPFPPPHIYRTFPLALAGTPFCPILLWILAPGWPLAPAAALFAFSAFFLLSLAVFFSLPTLMAACRAACRASGRCERRSLMTSSEAPTMPRWDFTVRRVRFLAISWGGC